MESTGGAAALMRLRDGTAVTAPDSIPIRLGFGESARDWFTGPGVLLQRGVFYELVSGEIEGVVWVIPETLIGRHAFAGLLDDYDDLAFSEQ